MTVLNALYYMIEDCSDGSAALRLFKTEAARDYYLDRILDDGGIDLSEGGGIIVQSDIDSAPTTLEDVKDLLGS